HQPVPRLEDGAHAAGAQQRFHVIARVSGQSRGDLARPGRAGRRDVTHSFRKGQRGEPPRPFGCPSWRLTDLADQSHQAIAGQAPEPLAAGVALGYVTLDGGLLVRAELAQTEGRQLLRAGVFELDGIHGRTLPSGVEWALSTCASGVQTY